MATSRRSEEWPHTPVVSRLQGLAETRQLLKDATAVLSRHASLHGGAFYYYLGGVRRVLVVTDPLVLRHMLKDNWQNYPKSALQRRRMGEFLGPGLLTDHGEEWRRKRRTLQKAFGPGRMEEHATLMDAALVPALANFDRRAAIGPIDLGRELTRLTFATTTRALFSLEMTDHEVEQISDGILAVQEFIVRGIVRPYLQPWWRLTREHTRHIAIRRGGDAILKRYIKAQDSRATGNLFAILLAAPLGPGAQQLSEQQILNEALQILVAGHETSSIALSWIIWLLATNSAELALVSDEMRRVVGTRPVRAADLARLPITTRAIEESLRLYPPFWMVDRVACANDNAAGVPIAAGTTVIAFIHGAHHSTSYWREPEHFLLTRSYDFDREVDHGYRYLPFGAGPKSCIGAGFAMLQMIIVLNALLKRYHLHVVNGSAVRPEARIILRPRGGILVNAIPRS